LAVARRTDDPASRSDNAATVSADLHRATEVLMVLRCHHFPPPEAVVRSLGLALEESGCADLAVSPRQLFLMLGFLFGWRTMLASIQSFPGILRLADVYRAHEDLALVDPVVDSVALVVPMLLAVRPLQEQAGPGCRPAVDGTALCALVSVLGAFASLLAEYPRAADHAHRISGWLLQLGSAVAAPARHDAPIGGLPLCFEISRALVTTCESGLHLVPEQAQALRQLCGSLQEYLANNPAVKAWAGVEKLRGLV
jgi:hypothetical protein